MEVITKRFTETEKWRDPWFRNLSSPAKQLWGYMLDHCDKIGLVHIDFRLATTDCGQKINESHLVEIGDRVEATGTGRYFIPKFINFQYGELTDSCPPHRPILSLVRLHGLIKTGILYHYPKPTLPLGYKIRQEEEKDKEEDREEDKNGTVTSPLLSVTPASVLDHYHKDARAALHALNEASGRHFRETDPNLTIISARLKEPGVDLDGIRMMIGRQVQRWKGTTHEEYLRPETLFNRTKFDGYYAARDLPVNLDVPGAKPKEKSLIDKEIDRLCHTQP